MKNKNNIYLIGAIIILICLIAFLLINNQREPQNSLQQLTYKEAQQKIKNKDSFVLVLSQTTCSHCANDKPILKEVVKKYNVTIYYLDYDVYEENEIDEILEFFNFDGGTPTTFFFIKGKEESVMNRLSGEVEKEQLIKALEKNGFLKS